MARNIPCLFCKQRRRKCEKIDGTDACKRCREQRRKCVTPTTSDSSDDEFVCMNADLQPLHQQIKQMEDHLRALEVSLQEQAKLTLATREKEEPRWDLEVVNGQLRLKSKISTLDELLQYGRAYFRYLPPFGYTFHKTSIAFDRVCPSFLQTAVQLISKYNILGVNGSQQQQFAGPYDVTQIVGFLRSSLPQFIHPRLVMDQLVNNYFACYNDSIPILHEPSFRKHYSSLDDPMNDPVVLAICATSSISTCRHALFYNLHERRFIGEQFYKLASDKLLDMFDDSKHALESVLVINILQLFRVTTLRLSESRKWASIATVICRNLECEEEEKSSQQQLHPERVVNSETDYLARVRSAVIHRNTVLVHCSSAIIEFMLGEKNFSNPQATCRFDILPDEPQKLKDLIEVMNHLFKFVLHPVFVVVMIQARNISAGDTAELTFEEIIRFEELVIEWWYSLPEHLKMCKEPQKLTKEMIQGTDDPRKLLVAVSVLCLEMAVQACLIHPKPANDLEHVYSVVRERAIKSVMHAADMVLRLSNKMEALGVYCYAPEKIIVRSIDCLINLANIPDEEVSKMAKLKLSEYMHELSRVIPTEHQVSPDVSPYSLLSITPPESAPDLFELYKNYPLPGEALLFDVVQTTVARNLTENNTTMLNFP